MIRVAVVDDHPAVRAGLHALLRSEPGLSPVAVPVDTDTTADMVVAAEPNVGLIDGQLPGQSGLELCLQISQVPDPPPLLLYSAYVDDELAIAARVAGAAGAVNKAEPLDHLLDALRELANGGTRFPPVAPFALRRCADRADADDLPFLSMLAHGTSREETADTLGVTLEELHARLSRLVSALDQSLMPGSGRVAAGL